MRRSTIGLLASFLIAGFAVACGSASDEDSASGQDAVGTKNLTASAFGLKDHELALTLDDGPGGRTVELAEWLAAEKVPATFFMVGNAAKGNQAAIDRVIELSNANNGLFLIGNHSMTHTTPLPQQGVQGSIDEIMNADAILKNSIDAAQKTYPNVIPFFRPPYGAFTALGAANIAQVNEAGAEKYTGPVFWDIGGDLANGFSADWACWGQKVSLDKCMDGYIAEANARHRGLMLCHDVHSKTVDMLTGKGTANGRSLIKELRAQGFTFVGLRTHEAQVQQAGQQAEQLASNKQITVDATVTQGDAGHVKVDVRTDGGARVEVAFDNEGPAAKFQGTVTVEDNLGPGQHFVTVTVFDAAGVAQKQERYTFTVATPVAPGADDPDNASCINYDALKAGTKGTVLHAKIACTDPKAVASGTPGECYRYQALLTASRDPNLVGATEWSTQYDMTYLTDPNDKSKVEFVFDSHTGTIESGRRFQWTTGTDAHAQSDAAFVVTSGDCAKGEWRGQIRYGSGASEDFLYRRAQ